MIVMLRTSGILGLEKRLGDVIANMSEDCFLVGHVQLQLTGFSWASVELSTAQGEVDCSTEYCGRECREQH